MYPMKRKAVSWILMLALVFTTVFGNGAIAFAGTTPVSENTVAMIGNEKFDSLQDAIDAAVDGETVKVVANLEMASSIFIKTGDAIVLDLNGKTIAGNDTATGSYGLINVNPGAELTITDSSKTNDGKITLKAENNRGWNAYSSVISNQRGKVIIEGGILEHLGGTAMAYAIDNLTNGKGTYAETIINGGTVKSTYRAIRQFQNGVEAQNILTINGGVVEGANKAVWMQDANINANSGTLTIVENAEIKGDVYLDVTAGSTEWPVTVNIAKGALASDSKILTEDVPNGFELKESAEGFGVVDTRYAAAIGSEKFETLKKALEAAKDGDVVKLLTDVSIDTETYTIEDGVSITLDMNGKKLTVTDSKASGNYELFYIYGEMEVIGDGTIELTATTNRAWNAMSAIFHNRGGVLTIENGTFKHLGGTDMAWVVDNSGNWYGDATTNIEGGTLHSTYTAIRNRMEENSHGASGTAYLNVSGGKITGATSAIWAQAASTSTTAPATGEINISGGEVGVVNTARSAGAECMTTITGGTVEAVKCEIGELTVTGGTVGTVTTLTAAGEEINHAVNGAGQYVEAVAQIDAQKYESLKAAFTAAKNGDEVKILKAGTYELTTSGKDITITGAVDGVVFDNIGARNMGVADVTFNNVTFDYYPNVNYTGLQHSGNLVYNNCTFNGQVFLYGESETFNKCTFNQNSADAYNVWTYGAKEVAFNDCTFNSVGKSVLIYAESANIFNDVTVTDCEFFASAPVDGKAAIEMDSSLTSGITLNVSGSKAEGFDNGTVSGNSLWNNKKGNDPKKGNNDITVVVDNETVLEIVYAAKINDAMYETLQDAIDAAKNGDTIVLLNDVTDNVTVTQAPNVKITIDGAGKTMKGAITVDGKSSAYETAGVTIKNVNFDGTGIAAEALINLGVSGNTKTRYTNNVTVENCTFTGAGKVAVKSYTGGDKNLTVKGCAVDNTMHSFLQLDNVTGVVVDDCTVNSKNGINLNSSSDVVIQNSEIDVRGYAVRIGAGSGGESGEVTLAGNVLKTDDSEGDAVVVIRGAAVTDVELDMSKNVVSGATHISGTTDATTVNADANYWDGKNLPVVEGSKVVVETYYPTADFNSLVRNCAVAGVGHDYEASVLAPTCNTAGYTTYTCMCGDSYIKDVVNPTGHDFKAVVTAPTCEAAGFTTKTCECGASYTTDITTAIGHKWDEGKVTTEATCTKNGVKTYTCQNDADHTRTEAIDKISHSYKAVVTAPTCTGAGYTTYTCACGESYITGITAALEHKWDAGKVTTKATCTKDGVKTYTCQNDATHTRTEAIAKAGHSYKAVVTAPTCEVEGYTTYTCPCGNTYIDNKVAAKGHVVAHTEKTKATVNENGQIVETCSCGTVISDKTIAKVESLKLSVSKATYTGKRVTPSLTILDSEGNKLKKGVDYKVSIPKYRKNVGKYKYKVTFKGNYSGTEYCYLTIAPKKPAIKAPKVAGNAVTVKWNKVNKQVTGYQVMIATDKKFTKNKKTVSMKGYKATDKKFANLKAKKTYFVKVRTYKTVKGVKFYSDWSKVKSVRAK